jgi:hypothetical protein
LDISRILDIIIFVIPGFILLSIYSLLTPSKKASDFASLVGSIIFSIPIYGFIYVIQTAVCLEIVLNRFLYVVFSWPLAIAVGWGMSWVQKNKAEPILKSIKIQYRKDPRIWNKFFSSFSNTSSFARFVLTDSTILIGYPKFFSIDPDDELQEVILNPCYEVDKNSKIIRTFVNDIYLNNDKIILVEILGTIRFTGPQPNVNETN